MICDGEEIRMVCRDCGHRFRHIIGYGPVCPLPGERERRLKKNPPVCPKCHSTNVEQASLGDRFK